jgi:hypothetical protein
LLRTGTQGSLRSWVQMTGLPVWPQTFAEALHSVKTGEAALKQFVGTEQYEDLLQEAGFRLSAVVPTASTMSVIKGSRAKGADFVLRRLSV